MNKKINIAAIICMILTGTMSAQTSYEAAHLIDNQLHGSARYVGMGGAMGAFGSDMSVIQKNPAGIGTFQSSELGLSLSVNGGSTKTDGLRRQESTPFLYFNNIGFVGNLMLGHNDAINFAFTYQRSKVFDRYVRFQTDIDKIVTQEDGSVLSDNVTERQYYGNSESGNINTFNFNISRAVDNRFYWGFTMGIHNAHYYSDAYFKSEFPNVSKDVYNEQGELEYTETPYVYTHGDVSNQIYGTGVSFAFGTIIRPIDASSWRIGLSVRTPTMYNMTFDYYHKLYSLQGKSLDGTKEEQRCKYKVNTPWIINASTGFTIGSLLAVGGEFEYQNAKHSAIYVNQSRLLDQTDADLLETYTARIGAEINADNVSFRVGYNYTSPLFSENAFKGVNNLDFNLNRFDLFSDNLRDRQILTFGIGVSSGRIFPNCYMDMVFMRQWDNHTISMKEDIDEPYQSYTAKRFNVSMSIGWIF